MASTIPLQRTVNYAQTCIRNAPLTGVGGFVNEPAFSIADWVRQFILSAPFMWRWNRSFIAQSTVQGQQDYTTNSLNNLGFIEKASITDGVNQKELQISLNLAQDTTQNRPISISTYIDNNNGVVIRLLPVPDKLYTVNINYQIAAPVFQNLTDTWAPIPDYYYYLIEGGFLAKTFEYSKDERYQTAMSLFVKQVVAANAGLSDTQKNLYLEEFINSNREMQAELGNSQAGRTARGLFG